MKNDNYRKEKLMQRYNEMLASTATRYLIEIHSLNEEEKESAFKRYDREWRITASNLNAVNGAIVMLNVEAFTSYTKKLSEKKEEKV